MKKTAAQIRKPTITPQTGIAARIKAAEAFATSETTNANPDKQNRSKAILRGKKGLSGQVPEGDVRLTCNIKSDLHLKLKIAAATRQATIGKAFTVGELIEELIRQHL